ncbi:hypothetical protein [Actinoallomurus rhizosphaericola]|uniref:hypothetical protein n=1 Tax=Actinoallomurus rhizosphaericola TaxID=2952536 RepID=UPI0020935011|nr:hypothetical protein [Actinoallomurus rhizosphaericola]MCO5999075.1 hypothetical protein [Actinoallomurus rhizosphaericola]
MTHGRRRVLLRAGNASRWDAVDPRPTRFYGNCSMLSRARRSLANTFSLPQIALGYDGLAIDAALFTILAARKPRTDTTEKSRAERRGIRPPDHIR